jgi:hypothetical protein
MKPETQLVTEMETLFMAQDQSFSFSHFAFIEH